MAHLSREMRRLSTAWNRGDWPKHLEWLEITGLRGWRGERVDFKFPIVAIVGENGSGKSTILQAAASIYKTRNPQQEKMFFASEFFPDTPWEKVEGVEIRASVREGNTSNVTKVRKPSTKWRGNPERRDRRVEFLDLRRTQPISARTGYAKLANRKVTESDSEDFDGDVLERLGAIVGKKFSRARHSLTALDARRRVPVVTMDEIDYSGFHQGAGETALADLLAIDFPRYGLILIDEIETSLHPRAQRRLVRDLAAIARINRLQVIITSHSPYVLEELPQEARVLIYQSTAGRQIIPGVSTEFALTRMDEDAHPEVDVYVEDDEARILLEEIIAKRNLTLLRRVDIVTYGAASVGKSLGQMAQGGRFRRPSIVLIDGEQDDAPGCLRLPGEDAPERVVFEALNALGWPDVATRVNRSHSQLVDAARRAMTAPNHHDWINAAADEIVTGGHDLWRAMCAVFVANCLNDGDTQAIYTAIEDKIDRTA